MTDENQRAATSGLHILQALVDGNLPNPSIGDTIPMTARAVEFGKITIEARPDDRHLNPQRMVHGGFAATCLDGAAGMALFSTLDDRTAYSTVDLGVKYLRPLKSGERYQVTGWLVERSKSLAICDAQIHDSAGKLCAKATTTFMIKG